MKTKYSAPQQETDKGFSPLLKAAALRADFTLDELLEASGHKKQGDMDAGLEAEVQTLLQDCMPAEGKRWRMRGEMRKKVLNDFSSLEQMAAFLPPRAIESETLLQKTLAQAIAGSLPKNIESLSIPELNALMMVSDWIGIFSPDIPKTQLLQAELARKEFLAPLLRYTEHFQGRQKELKSLDDFVNMPYSDKRFLAVTGIGGSGKSTLVSKFILDQIGHPTKPPLPFAFIDFDQPGAVLEPVLLLIEIARQLELQHLEGAAALRSIRQRWEQLAQENKVGQKGQRTRSVERDLSYLPDLERLWRSTPSLSNQPLLLVFDSFEEVQKRVSESEQFEFLRFLEDFSQKLPNTRIIVVGRAEVEGFKMPTMTLRDFDRDAALGFLKVCGVTDEALAAEIFERVGGIPLTLKLAAEVVRKEGNNPGVLQQIDQKRVQEELFRRQLEHITDARARQIALPGLVVRILTPEVIRDVLADACGLGYLDDVAARETFEILEKEAFLVEKTANGLRFRSDLRKKMLPLIALQEPQRARQIHDCAVTYYADRPDAASRAEWLYHRLKRGDATHQISADIDFASLRPYLENALEELPAHGHVFLAQKFGITVPSALLRVVDDISLWEAGMAKKIQESFDSGEDEALERLRPDVEARSERSENSPLHIAEAWLYERLGQLDKALQVAQAAAHEARQAMDQGKERKARYMAARILERQGRYPDAEKMVLSLIQDIKKQHIYDAYRAAFMLMRLLRRQEKYKFDEAKAVFDDLEASARPAGAGYGYEIPREVDHDLLKAFYKEFIPLSVAQEWENAPEPLLGPWREWGLGILPQRWLSAKQFESALERLMLQTSDNKELETLLNTRLNYALRTATRPGAWETCTYDVLVFLEKEEGVERLLTETKAMPEDKPRGAEAASSAPENSAPLVSATDLLLDISKSALEADNFEECLLAMESLLIDYSSYKYDDSIKTQVNRIKNDYRAGVISEEEANKQNARIALMLKDLLYDLKENLKHHNSADLHIKISSESSLAQGSTLAHIDWLKKGLQVVRGIGLVTAANGNNAVGCLLPSEKVLTVAGVINADRTDNRIDFRYVIPRVASKNRRSLEWPFFASEAVGYWMTGLEKDDSPSRAALTLNADYSLQSNKILYAVTIENKDYMALSVKLLNQLDGVLEVAGDDFLAAGSPVFDLNWQLAGIVGQKRRFVSLKAIVADLATQGFYFDKTASTPASAPQTDDKKTSPSEQTPQVPRFLVLYDEADAAAALKLGEHMAGMRRVYRVNLFLAGRDVPPGEVWQTYLDKELAAATWVVCLVSANFMAGDWYDWAEKAQKMEKRLIPICLRSTDLRDSLFEKLRTLPSQGRTIASFSNEDEAYTQVVEELRRLLG